MIMKLVRKHLLEGDPEFLNIVVHYLMRKKPAHLARGSLVLSRPVGLIPIKMHLMGIVLDGIRNSR